MLGLYAERLPTTGVLIVEKYSCLRVFRDVNCYWRWNLLFSLPFFFQMLPLLLLFDDYF